MKQAEMIKRLSDRELKKQLILSQLIFLLLSIILSFVFFDKMNDWFHLFQYQPKELMLFGVLPAVGLVLFEIILYTILPENVFDDGGINERIFKGQSIGWIAVISLVVAISEEFLFRGVIQVSFGYIFASSLFVIVHVRYLKKPILFLLIVATSFLIGYLFLLTENILVTIVFHFIVDFLLGIFIRYKK